jgi:hypothetical protein
MSCWKRDSSLLALFAIANFRQIAMSLFVRWLYQWL